MLTLKIRVPYKEGSLEDILDRLSPNLCCWDGDIVSYGIVDNEIEIRILNDEKENVTLDLRLLEITGG